MAERYPEDLLADITYGRVLAFYRMGREEEAAKALTVACRLLPLVADYLIGRRTDEPEIHPFAFRLGGADQAWVYLEEMGDLWRATPQALEWMEQRR